MGYKLQSDLSEKQIEADVSNFFGWCSPAIGQHYRLLDVDERLTGADKFFTQVHPIYIQFKVSHGLRKLPSEPQRSLQAILDLSPLKRIRYFRNRMALDDNPTLYFKLRAKAKNADELQHNVLAKLNSIWGIRGFYVAPLTLNKVEYEQMLFDSADRFNRVPFFESYIQDIYQSGWMSQIGLVPFLRGHISIPPHEHVDSDNHYYSYSKNGTDVAWHSPQLLPDSAMRLSDKIITIIKSLRVNSEGFGADFYLKQFKEEPLISGMVPEIDNEDGLRALQEFGVRLYDEYGIKQFLLTGGHAERTYR